MNVWFLGSKLMAPVQSGMYLPPRVNSRNLAVLTSNFLLSGSVDFHSFPKIRETVPDALETPTKTLQIYLPIPSRQYFKGFKISSAAKEVMQGRLLLRLRLDLQTEEKVEQPLNHH